MTVELKPAPLWMTATPARCGIEGTTWGGLGIGRDKFRRLVKAGVIPSLIDEETGHRYYSRLALEAWALHSGAAA